MSRSGEIHQVTAFAKRLDDAHIHYRLESNRSDAVMFSVVVPGEHWEIEFLDDGSVEVEVFRSDGSISNESVLESLFESHAG